MPRKVHRLMKINYTSAIVLGMLLFTSFIPLSEAAAPVWSYHIEEITAAAMAQNGEYIIIGTQEGYFYVFDKFGNVIRSDNAKSEVTAVDISENGTFFVGTKVGYYFSTLQGDPYMVVNRKVGLLSVSISDDGQYSIIGTEIQIYLFNESNLMKELSTCIDLEECKEVDWIKITDISSSGDVAVAATENTLYLYERKTDYWRWREFDEDKITTLAVSDNGQTVACGTENGMISVLSIKLDIIASYEANGGITDLRLTEDGNQIVCGIGNSAIGFIEVGEEPLWMKEPLYFESLAMSSNGLIAAVGEKLYLLNSSGKILQEIILPAESHTVFLSRNGQYTSCVSENEVVFFELYNNTCNYFREFKCSSRKSLPISDTLVKTENFLEDIDDLLRILKGDVNGDGQNEVAFVSGNKVFVTSKSGKILSEIEFSIKPRLRRFLDVTGDLIPEIIVSHDDGRMALEFYDRNGTLLAQHEFYKRWWEKPVDGCDIIPLKSFDIDDDGLIEVICLVRTGYELIPRGIYVFEYPTFSEEWYYPFAPYVATPVIKDLDGDGELEILFGSSAPCNGRIVGDTDDCHVYVAVIDLQGRELWIREIGEGFKELQIGVADLDGDGTNEVVCGGLASDDTWGKLFVLDKDGEYVRGEDDVFGHSVFLGGVSDLDRDGKMEILTFSSEGNIVVFDYLLNLKQEKKIEINMGRYTHAIINDIDADGEKEIILYSKDERVYILSSDLEVEWIESFTGFEGKVRVHLVNLYGCKNDLIIFADKIYVYSHQHDNTDTPCPLWEITERNLTTEATECLTMAESAFEAKKYITSRLYYKKALDIHKKLEDEEMMTNLSETIFELDVQIGMILLSICDAGLCIFLVYSWFRKSWSRLAEGTLLLSLPVLLGLFQVHAADKEYLQAFVTSFVPSVTGSTAIMLRRNILGFARTIAVILSGHKDIVVLSIIKSDGSYRISVESFKGMLRPVKESKEVIFPLKAKKELIKKIEFVIGILDQFSSAQTEKISISYAEKYFREIGGDIYQRFIPEDFSNILKSKFLLLEVEDTEVPWELMYSDGFFASKYAISRRIVTTKSVRIRQKKTYGRRALIISDPLENLPGAETECEIVYSRLTQKMETVLVKGHNARVEKVANLLGQGFDIIHFAGHVDKGLLLSDSVMSPEKVQEYTAGTPVVFVNGCRSEELARAFLLGGAMAYVGMIHPVHDSSAARIAADFYELCLEYQVGEALRRARQSYMNKDVVWASLVMYGDPTLKLL